MKKKRKGRVGQKIYNEACELTTYSYFVISF